MPDPAPAGESSPGGPAAFRASRTEDLVPFFERLRDQEFSLGSLTYRVPEKAVDLVLFKKFPPHRGTWALRIAGVRRWDLDRRGPHERETLKDIVLDAKAGTVTLKCVLHDLAATVDRLDLRLARLDQDEPDKVQYRDLPAWFRQEVQQNLNAIQAEEERVVAAKKRIQRMAFAWGSAAPLILGLFTGGNALALLAFCPLVAGTTAYFLAGTNRSPQVAGVLYGLAASAACLGSGAGNLFTMFFIPLLLLCLGIAMMIGLRGERDLTV